VVVRLPRQVTNTWREKMFKVLDETSYSVYKDMELETVTRWKSNNWKCITKNGFYLNIIIKGGTLYLDLAETENALGDHAMPVIKYNDKTIKDLSAMMAAANKITVPQISFEQIKEFMNWTCNPEKMWDI